MNKKLITIDFFRTFPKYIIVVLIFSFPSMVFSQVNKQPTNEKSILDPKVYSTSFDCEIDVDLRIFSANSISPVLDADEFKIGASGVTNSSSPIKVEFLAIPGISTGEVTLTFNIQGSGEFDVLETNGDFIATVTGGAPMPTTLIKNVSDLPYTVLLRTEFSSNSYRDIIVEMEHVGVIDKARATVYPENNTPSILIKADDGTVHPWTPDNPFTGNSLFVSEVNQALFAILNNGLGNYNVTLSNSIQGHVINDFLEGGRLSFSQIEISETPWGIDVGAGSSNTQIDFSTGKAALKIFEESGTINQQEGFIAPFIFLLHELAHVWLNKFDPRLDEILSNALTTLQKAPLYVPYGVTHDYTDSFEHDLILTKIENPACEQLGFGVRKYYDNTVYTDDIQQAQILTLEQSQVTPPDSDIFYKSTSSLVTTPE